MSEPVEEACYRRNKDVMLRTRYCYEIDKKD